MAKLKAMDVLFYALQCAKSDRFAFADAVEGDKKEYEKAMADIKAFTSLQIKIFGTANSELDSATNKMKSVTLKDMMDLFETDPDLFIHASGCECKYCAAEHSAHLTSGGQA